MLTPLLTALRLKHVPREGWKLRGLSDVESVAAHSWGVAWLVLLYLPDNLCLERALRYAVIHDLAESTVGDITPHDGISREEKHLREEHALRELFAQLNRPDLLQSWLDYEAQADPEAQFVRQLDRLDMGLQAIQYAERELNPTEFIASALDAIHTPRLQALLKQ